MNHSMNRQSVIANQCHNLYQRSLKNLVLSLYHDAIMSTVTTLDT